VAVIEPDVIEPDNDPRQGEQRLRYMENIDAVPL